MVDKVSVCFTNPAPSSIIARHDIWTGVVLHGGTLEKDSVVEKKSLVAYLRCDGDYDYWPEHTFYRQPGVSFNISVESALTQLFTQKPDVKDEVERQVVFYYQVDFIDDIYSQEVYWAFPEGSFELIAS